MQPDFNVSEDCLTLNVFRSDPTSESVRPHQLLPVVVWIHGGDFVAGASSIYDGSKIVSRASERGTPIVFVSINYRLGPLGFPIGSDSARKDVLNLGLKDQLVALEWVHKYITYFDGDPEKVTLWGESAGAHSVDIHFLGPTLKNYARAGIIQSTYWDPQYGPEHNLGSWVSFVSSAGCTPDNTTEIKCLRGANVTKQDLLDGWAAAANELAFNPVIDGPGGILPDLPSRLKPGSRIPVIIGTTKDEGTLFTPQDINSTEPIHEWVISHSTPSPRGQQALEDATNQLLNEFYPDDPVLGAPFGTGNETFGLNSQFKRWAALWGDFAIEAHTRELRHLVSSLDIPLYGYQFADADAKFLDIGEAPGSLGSKYAFKNPQLASLLWVLFHVTHATDLPYVFGNGSTQFPGPSTPNAQTLSEQMMDYWISFIVSLDPNDGKGANRTKWQRYTNSAKNVLQFNGTTSKMIPDTWREERTGFISQDPILWHR
ncbi:esterase 1 [Flagelloscypha sp. PMI_526]|nr:esterase 1 [Flagelloscypha sp. PMI_526]